MQQLKQVDEISDIPKDFNNISLSVLLRKIETRIMYEIKKHIKPVTMTKFEKWYISLPIGLIAMNKNGEIIEIKNKTKITSIDFEQ